MGTSFTFLFIIQLSTELCLITKEKSFRGTCFLCADIIKFNLKHDMKEYEKRRKNEGTRT